MEVLNFLKISKFLYSILDEFITEIPDYEVSVTANRNLPRYVLIVEKRTCDSSHSFKITFLLCLMLVKTNFVVALLS